MRLSAIACIILLAMSQVARGIELEARQLTRGPEHHFFGYIGHVQNIPWNKSGRFLVALRTRFQDHMPDAGEAAEIVLLDTTRDYGERVVERTLAWNPQQGTMLYWNPKAQETQFFFNDRDPKTGRIFTVLCEIDEDGKGRRVREYRYEDTPVGNSGVSQKGGWFAAINYARLARLRPVTGYPEAFDWTKGVSHPADDGVFRVDVESGEKQLLVSFERLAEVLRPTHPEVDSKHLFINHTLSNRDGDRIFFFVRGDFDAREGRVNEPFLINPDGTGLTRMKTFIGGHPEWETGRRMIGAVDGVQVVYDTDSQRIVSKIGTREILPDPGGDIALSPDGKWLVNGTRRDGRNFYTFVNRATSAVVVSEGFDVRGWTSGDLRCDPAPCWNRESNAIVFPAIADDAGKTRQMFMIRIRE